MEARTCGAHSLPGRDARSHPCASEVQPLQSRIEAVGEEADLKAVYDTGRRLLYVACTRARDFLWVSGVEPAWEFLEDLQAQSGVGAS